MTSTYPNLTIALQTYNRSANGFLRESLEAILNQTYTEFELMVLDNHSTDETANLVLSYKDPRLIYVRQPPGKTPDTNFNSAMWMGRGEYILATHDDDIMEPTMIQRMIDFLHEHPNLACLAANVSLIDSQGTIIQPRLYEIWADRIFEQGEYIGTYLKEKLWLPTPTCLFHRGKTIAVKGQEARATSHRYQPSADILVLCLLNVRDSIALLAEPLLRYRQHPGQESRNVDQSEPLLTTVTGLLTHCRRLKAHLPALHAAKARYSAQDVLFRQGKDLDIGPLLGQVATLKLQWEKAVPPQARALDSVLPFEILICLFGLEPSIPQAALGELLGSQASDGASQAYRNWTHLAHRGLSLFKGRPSVRRIAILGSMFTAHLIAYDARRAGIEVICCLDSAPARLGRSVLGVPVVSHEALKEMPFIDAVILSSERDHEAALRRILQPNLPKAELPTPSWKELALESHLLSQEEGAC